jgi:plasmid rolling circle replication initiator protein Rep
MPITATEPVYLSALSSKDSKWDERRAEADGFKNLYRDTDFDCYANRITNCSELLVFAFAVNDTGECALKLQAARFCRVRHCPVCQWRRSLMWRAKAFKVLPQLMEQYPKSRFIFLTLTVKNCQLSELRDTLDWMNKAWKKLTERKTWPAQGWIKSVEVTRSHDGSAHPHFHCLLMVPPSYFKGGAYLSQERWAEVWQACLKVDYMPMVHVQAVKPPKGIQKATGVDAMFTALCETLKYTVKAADILGDESDTEANQAWLVELTKQLHKTRAVATGGVLKQSFKMLEEDPDDLIHADENGINEADIDSPRVAFGWREKARRYRLTETR